MDIVDWLDAVKRKWGGIYCGYFAKPLDTAHKEILHLREQLAAAQAECIALQNNLREATEWRPIESAPKNGDWLLIYDPRYKNDMPATIGSYMNIDGRDAMGRFKKGEWFGFEWDGMPSTYEPTHWRPLPAKPEGV